MGVMADASMPRVPDASPWKLGGLGVRELARRVWNEIWEDEVFDRAAALSYYFLFALFPTLLFMTVLLGLVPGPELMSQFLAYVTDALPADAASVVQKTLDEIVSGASGGLLSVGVLAALWASSAGMVSIISALNVVYEVTEPRPWWKRRLIAIVLTVGFVVFVMTAMLLLIFGPKIGQLVAGRVGLGPVFALAWSIARWPVAAVLGLIGISLVYYLAPAVRQRWHWVTPGSAFSLGAWLLASVALQQYVAHFADYNKTYGSIGGVILLLLWLYVSSLVLLVGAEINSEIASAAREAARKGQPATPGVPAARKAG